MEDDKYGGWRWFRQEPPERTQSITYTVGVTPNYYSPRYNGSFNKYTSGVGFFIHQCLWKDRVGTPSEVLETDATLRADFREPPTILVPEERIALPASVSGAGTSPGRGLGMIFEYRAEGVALHGETQARTGTGANPPFRKDSINPYFIVPIPNERSGKLKIHAFLWNAPCNVTWTYEARRVSTATSRRVGTIIQPRGVVEHYTRIFKKWRGPIRGESPVHEGDRVKTGPNSSCMVVFTDRAGRQETITVGADTLLEIPWIPELQPRYSIMTIIRKGIIKSIRKAIFREPPTEEELLDQIFYRSPTIAVTRRGTEFIMSVGDDGATEVYVNEGHVEITNLITNQKTALPSGQRMIVVKDGTENKGHMALGQWRNLNASHFPDKSGDPSGYDLPFLKANIKGLRFFESGYDPPVVSQRQYSAGFSKAASRYINWELGLDFPAPGRRVDFDIIAVWYKPDGSVLARQTPVSYVDSHWTNSIHNFGWGWKEPGNWAPGTYRVDLLLGDRIIATGSFEIR